MANSRDSTEHVNKKPRIDRESFDTMVIVKVGPDKTVFRMHKRIICNVSPFFKVAFEGKFREAQDQILELPDENVDMFKYFQLWVYTDSIIAKGETVKDLTGLLLADLYIFGEMCGIPDLQNAAIDVLIDKYEFHQQITTLILHKVYGNTPETTPLRRLMVDFVACIDRGLPDWFANSRDQYPTDFLIDLAVALSKLKCGTKTVIMDFRASRFDYHVKPTVSLPVSEAAASKQR